MNYKRTFIIFLIVLIFSACSKKSIQSISVKNIEEAIFLYNSNFNKINSFNGKVSIQLNIEKFNIKLRGFLTIIKPDSLSFEIYGPLGIHIGNFYLLKDSIVIVDNYNDRIIKTNSNDTIIKSFLGNDFDLKNLIQLLLGYLFPQETYELKNTSDEDKIEFIETTTNFIIIYNFNLFENMIDNIIVKNYDNEVILQVSYEDFIHVNDIKLPSLISVETTSNKNRITLRYEDIKINQDNLKIQVEIPEASEELD